MNDEITVIGHTHEGQMTRAMTTAIGLLALCVSSAAAQLDALPEGSVRMMDVNGTLTRVLAVDIDVRVPGRPVLVLFAGGGSPMETWGPFLQLASELAPIVTYDRPGLGESEWDGFEQTPERVAEHTQEVLRLLGVEPPYVLLGHSWGGPLSLYYAGTHPADILGLVHIDPTERDFTWERFFLTSDPVRLAGCISEWESFLANADLSAGVAAEYAVIGRIFGTSVEDRGIPPYPDLPTALVLGTRFDDPGLSCATRDLFQQSQAERTGRLLGEVRRLSKATLIMATDAGHFVHLDDPALVVAALRRVLEEVTSGR